MTKSLSERIARIKAITTEGIERGDYSCMDCDNYDDAYDWGEDHGRRDVAVVAVKIIEELQAENQAIRKKLEEALGKVEIAKETIKDLKMLWLNLMR